MCQATKAEGGLEEDDQLVCSTDTSWRSSQRGTTSATPKLMFTPTMLASTPAASRAAPKPKVKHAGSTNTYMTSTGRVSKLLVSIVITKDSKTGSKKKMDPGRYWLVDNFNYQI